MRFPFLGLNNILSCVYILYFAYLVISHGHLGCLYLSGILISAAMGMGVQITLRDPDFKSLGIHIPRDRVVGSHGNSGF